MKEYLHGEMLPTRIPPFMDEVSCMGLWFAIVHQAMRDVWYKGDLHAYVWLATDAPDMFDAFGIERQQLLNWVAEVRQPPYNTNASQALRKMRN